MNTRSAKAKGKRLCERIRQKLLDIAMTLEPDDIHIPVGSVPGEDILLSPKARAMFPFSFEAKNQEKLNIWSALEQSEGHAKSTERIPLVIFSRNHSKDYVALEFDTFLKCFKGGVK